MPCPEILQLSTNLEDFPTVLTENLRMSGLAFDLTREALLRIDVALPAFCHDTLAFFVANYLLQNLQLVLKRLEDGTLCGRHATDVVTVAAQDCVVPEPEIKGAADACKLPTNMRFERTGEDIRPCVLFLHRGCDATEFPAGFF